LQPPHELFFLHPFCAAFFRCKSILNKQLRPSDRQFRAGERRRAGTFGVFGPEIAIGSDSDGRMKNRPRRHALLANPSRLV
jgi:hypothetical protein